MKQAISAEMPDWKMSDELWYNLLVKDPHPDFRLVQNQSLSFWIRAFNRWQELLGWNPDAQRNEIDANQLKPVLGMEFVQYRTVIKLFDPEGFRKVTTEGATTNSLSKVRVNIRELMIAGVMLSRHICIEHKLRFAFGLVDINDSRALDERQFFEFISSFIKGMACAFGLGHDQEMLPTEKQIKIKARRLYKRIGLISVQRLLAIHDAQTDGNKASLVRAMKARCGELMQDMQEAQKKERGSSRSGRPRGQVLQYSTLQDWCLRVFKDPLALPYALAIERFRAERQRDIVDRYDDAFSDFYLWHTRPVHVGEQDIQVDDSDLLTRQEVTVAKQVFEKAVNCNFHVTVHKLESDMDLKLDGPIGEKLRRGITTADELFRCARDCILCGSYLPNNTIFCGECGRRRDKASFPQFLEYMCPQALPKHIAMFIDWTNQCEELLNLTKMIKVVKDAQRQFFENSTKPFLPENDCVTLTRNFEIVSRGRGFITKSDLRDEFHWDGDIIDQTIQRFDIDDTGNIDKWEFLRMMCPLEYRMPQMSGYERQLFGKLLENRTEKLQRELDLKMRPWLADSWREFLEGEISEERRSGDLSQGHQDPDENETWRTMFAKASVGRHQTYEIKARPDSVLPEVEEEEWNRWNAIFDEIDEDKDGVINNADLEYKGWLSHRLTHYVMQVIDPETPESCKKRGFLQALLQACGKRRVGFFG
mmetsp:Transcript_71023/g.134241  ORF Transcript_71023/g.134241 Transcript_71023/m.134241 type:complete len:705 (-) Transcript_71023:115-2229(-)